MSVLNKVEENYDINKFIYKCSRLFFFFLPGISWKVVFDGLNYHNFKRKTIAFYFNSSES
jgi:hypothetical protein